MPHALKTCLHRHLATPLRIRNDDPIPPYPTWALDFGRIPKDGSPRLRSCGHRTHTETPGPLVPSIDRVQPDFSRYQRGGSLNEKPSRLNSLPLLPESLPPPVDAL